MLVELTFILSVLLSLLNRFVLLVVLDRGSSLLDRVGNFSKMVRRSKLSGTFLIDLLTTYLTQIVTLTLKVTFDIKIEFGDLIYL